MARKTSTTRASQRGNRAKARRNVELVMPEHAPAPVAAQSTASTATAVQEKVEVRHEAETKSKTVSASARLAARRQETQRARQRGVGSFMTLEDYSYIKRDLITITILSVIMMSTIIALYFVIGG